MTHCTVCGAAAREGAKFCTTCGARIQDTPTPDTSAAEQTATLPAATEEAEAPIAEETVDTGHDSVTETTTYVPDHKEPEPAEPAPAPDDHYASSWPSSESADEGTSPAREEESGVVAPVAASTEVPGWSAASEASEAPASATVDGDTATRDDDDHHGASGWESWAPTPSPAAAVAEHDDSLDSIREAIDTLMRRVDRLVSPASLASRGVDPDDLADEMERWTGDDPETGELLAAIQAVREAPRDLDAVTRLADHAADLEAVVERYRSITSSSETWASRLRGQRSEDSST